MACLPLGLIDPFCPFSVWRIHRGSIQIDTMQHRQCFPLWVRRPGEPNHRSSATISFEFFIFGLAPEIQHEVQALQPLTLVQAVGLARLQEEKFLNSQRSLRGRMPPISSSVTLSPLSSSILSHSSPLLPTPLKLPPSFSIKRLSPEELTLRRECDLYFNCNEKFHRSHKCTSKFFLLIADDDDGPQENNLEISLLPDPPNIPAPTPAQINLHIFSIHLALETLHLLGHIVDQ